MRALLVACAILVAPTGAQAQAGGVQVRPVVMEASAERGMTSFRMQSARAEDASFEVVAYAWTQAADGRTQLTPTDAIVVAPSVFLISPGQEQIVRVGLVPQARGGAREQSYRLLVRELPRSDGAGFRLLLELSLPVFFRPANAGGGVLNVTRMRGPDGAPEAVFENTGDSHVRLSGYDPGVDGLPRYVLAGARVVRPLTGRRDSLDFWIADGAGQPQRQVTYTFDDAPRLAGLR